MSFSAFAIVSCVAGFAALASLEPIQLRAGDVFKVAFSTRQFVVEGSALDSAPARLQSQEAAERVIPHRGREVAAVEAGAEAAAAGAAVAVGLPPSVLLEKSDPPVDPPTHSSVPLPDGSSGQEEPTWMYGARGRKDPGVEDAAEIDQAKANIAAARQVLIENAAASAQPPPSVPPTSPYTRGRGEWGGGEVRRWGGEEGRNEEGRR